MRPSHLKRTKRGTQSAVNGTSIAAIVTTISAFCARPVDVAIAKPANDATRTVIGTATTTTKNELPMFLHSGRI